MASTTTADVTLQQILNRANPNQLNAGLLKVKLGNVLGPVKVVVTGLTAASAIDITSAAVRAAATITGLDRAAEDNLPAINLVKTLRITASGTSASLGAYIVTDAGGTAIVPPGGASAAVGVALLSDDGKTITFPNTVTAFVLEYMPRPEAVLSTVWASGA